MVSKVCLFLSRVQIIDKHSSRCYALPSEFDQPGPPRSPEHTDCILEMFGTQDLWDAFGVIEEILVRVLLGSSVHSTENP
jgi:hypothetical protein